MLYYQPLKSPRRELGSVLPCVYYIHCVYPSQVSGPRKRKEFLCCHPAAPPWRQAASPSGEVWSGRAPTLQNCPKKSYWVPNICTRSYQPRKQLAQSRYFFAAGIVADPGNQARERWGTLKHFSHRPGTRCIEADEVFAPDESEFRTPERESCAQGRAIPRDGCAVDFGISRSNMTLAQHRGRTSPCQVRAAR